MTRRPVLVVQHEEHCPPAWFSDWMGEVSCPLDVRRPYAGEVLPGDLDGHGGLLVLGGSMGSYDDDRFPWLTQVRELFALSARRSVPALGICLGHQLAAVALRGRVVVNPRGQQLGLTEVGWSPEASDDQLFARSGMPDRGVQWNNDIVAELPEGAVPLARTAAGELQAARFAPTVWGVQLHPEADESVVAPWADLDRARYPTGVVDDAVAAIRAARAELAESWRPLATAFAGVVQGQPDPRRT